MERGGEGAPRCGDGRAGRAVVTEIARNAEVCASLLYRWRRELLGACKMPRFVPVQVAPESGDEGSASAPACMPP